MDKIADITTQIKIRLDEIRPDAMSKTEKARLKDYLNTVLQTLAGIAGRKKPTSKQF